MTRWIELPDTERGTGRTTRMAKAAALASHNYGWNILVVADNHAECTRLSRVLADLHANMTRVDIQPRNEVWTDGYGRTTLRRKNANTYNKEQVFWDHYALDNEQREHMQSALLRTADIQRF
jgi:Asp-tRNA(Asn)/Glu-tRNA(Gln) amidotransferase A subunit family amidase